MRASLCSSSVIKLANAKDQKVNKMSVARPVRCAAANRLSRADEGRGGTDWAKSRQRGLVSPAHSSLAQLLQGSARFPFRNLKLRYTSRASSLQDEAEHACPHEDHNAEGPRADAKRVGRAKERSQVDRGRVASRE